MNASSHELIATDAWELEVPASVTASSPLVCVPTVHPRGDRRVVSCAQVALDAGYRVHFVWLGGGTPSSNPLVTETILDAPKSTLQRIGSVRAVARKAAHFDASLWHIHDFYMLGQAKRWHRASGKPVVYDVHEYYADYYPMKLPIPGFARRLVGRIIEQYQTRSTLRVGGANVVANRMAAPFVSRGVPTSVCPNYPRRRPLESVAWVPFGARKHKVIHMGTLTEDYGTETLIRLIERSHERKLPFQFSAISRFPSERSRKAFESMVVARGVSLEMLAPRAPHLMPDLLSQFGFGLSLLADKGGQNDLAIPAKNTEHVLMGMVAVVSDRPAQRRYVEEWGVEVVLREDNLDAALDAMLSYAEDSDTDEMLMRSMQMGRDELTWEGRSAPEFDSLLRKLMDTQP